MHFNKRDIEFRACPVCKNKPYKRFEQFLKNKIVYDTVICDNCGFVFQNPIYNKEHYHSLPCSYPENYWSHSYRRATYISDFCNEYLKDKNNISMLDIGAGKGGVLMNLHIKMFNITNSVGITLENDNALFSDDMLFKFDFEDDERVNEFISKNEKKFDFIIMSHVLEHFIDPEKAMNNVKKLLAPGGIVYIEVPSLYNAEYRIKSVWTPEHLSYFNTKILSRLMYQNNFNLVKMTDSKIWGNIKSIWKYGNGLETFRWSNDSDVKNKYKANKIAKFIQRLKHKLGFKYEANI